MIIPETNEHEARGQPTSKARQGRPPLVRGREGAFGRSQRVARDDGVRGIVAP